MEAGLCGRRLFRLLFFFFFLCRGEQVKRPKDCFLGSEGENIRTYIHMNEYGVLTIAVLM